VHGTERWMSSSVNQLYLIKYGNHSVRLCECKLWLRLGLW